MMTFPYDETYDPAAPVCQINLSVASTGLSVSLPAIIDTGADATIVPLGYLRQIGARRVFEAGLRSQWGERRRVYLYLIDLRLGEFTLPGVYVVGDDRGDEVVLGRDVLNRLRLLLDGPKRVSQVSE
ncbi:MAG: retroviral-like aspartic protease family protein [Anaerolineae bacterium]